MIPAFLAGAAAGYGIAIPVGAIAILIVETGLRRGFRLAAAAGTGAAAADGIYAAVAAVFGAALATAIAPYETPLRAVSVVVLVAIALRGLAGLRRAAAPAAPMDPGPGTGRGLDGQAATGPGGGSTLPPGTPAAARGTSVMRTFGAFLGLTLLNPLTVTYFAALILGLAATGAEPGEKAAFVAGAFLASLSWQTLLAAVGALLHRRLSPSLRAGVILLGNAIILGFAAVIAAGLVA